MAFTLPPPTLYVRGLTLLLLTFVFLQKGDDNHSLKRRHCLHGVRFVLHYTSNRRSDFCNNTSYDRNAIIIFWYIYTSSELNDDKNYILLQLEHVHANGRRC